MHADGYSKPVCTNTKAFMYSFCRLLSLKPLHHDVATLLHCLAVDRASELWSCLEVIIESPIFQRPRCCCWVSVQYMLLICLHRLYAVTRHTSPCPNEQFFSDLSYVSGIQPVNIDPARTTVIIDDSAEPECGKCIVCVSISSSEANELVLCHTYS